MPANRLQLPKMRHWGLLPFLVPLIFLWSIQKPQLTEGLFFSKYWVQVLAWREET